MGFTLDQLKVLAIIPHVTGSMSVIGSSIIMFDVLRDRKKWKKTYNRLLFVMSMFDCLTSASFAFSTLPIPKETVGVYNPHGTTATCTLQGFFVQLSIIGPMYNCMLATYYYLLIVRGMSEDRIASKVEPYMHATCWILAFGMGFTLLQMEMFNSATLWCWQNDYPANCEGSYGEPGPVPCERGKHAWLFRWLFYYGLLWVIMDVTAVIMFILYQTVRKQDEKVAKYDFRLSSGLDSEESRKVRRQNHKRSQKVLSQALFFMGAFFLTFLAGSINRFTQLVTGKSVYILLVLHCVFAPAQGFFNFLVYMRPKIIELYNKRYARKGGISSLSTTRNTSNYPDSSLRSLTAEHSNLKMAAVNRDNHVDIVADNHDIQRQEETKYDEEDYLDEYEHHTGTTPSS